MQNHFNLTPLVMCPTPAKKTHTKNTERLSVTKSNQIQYDPVFQPLAIHPSETNLYIFQKSIQPGVTVLIILTPARHPRSLLFLKITSCSEHTLMGHWDQDGRKNQLLSLIFVKYGGCLGSYFYSIY